LFVLAAALELVPGRGSPELAVLLDVAQELEAPVAMRQAGADARLEVSGSRRR
jgi:hypothetical protein